MRLPLPHALAALGLTLALGTAGIDAQRAPIGDAIRDFVAVDASIVALTNARVIDGTGGPARNGQTLVLRDGVIAAMGPSASTPPPAGAHVVDLAGKSVIPGLVMLHEHLYYPTGPGVYGQLGQSFVRLYLAGGVTTMRTGGNMNGFMDITLKQRVEAGDAAGPTIDATMPYVNGVNPFVQMTNLTTEERARRHVAYWADEGATSVKAYMQISRAALGTAIREAHARGLKVTGHLCSVTYAEAAALGIDNLEHGFFAATDFVSDKKPDECPGQGRGQQAIADIDPKGAPFQTLIRTLIPGFSNHRQLELLVEAGFTPLEALSIGTRNGARYLGQESKIGTLAVGRQADVVVVDGDPSTTIADVRKVSLVFRRGVGFDPRKLIQSVSGKVGLW